MKKVLHRPRFSKIKIKKGLVLFFNIDSVFKIIQGAKFIINSFGLKMLLEISKMYFILVIFQPAENIFLR